MGENGCLKDAKFMSLESVGPARIVNDLEVDGGGIFNQSLYVNDTITCGRVHKGYLYSTIEVVNGIADGPIAARDADRDPNTLLRDNNGSKIEFLFNKALPKNAVISDLSLKVINASFNSSSTPAGGATTLMLGASGDRFGYAGNEEKFIYKTSFLNASSDVLSPDKTYSLIKDNIVIQANKLKEGPIWWNSSHCFNGSALHPKNSSTLNINTLLNASEETQPILVLEASPFGPGEDTQFLHNCSIQAFITYNSPYPVDPEVDPERFNY